MNNKAFFLAPFTLLIGLLWLPLFFEKSFSADRELIDFQNSFDSAVLLKTAVETDIVYIVESELENSFMENNALKIKEKVNKKLLKYFFERQKLSGVKFVFFNPVSVQNVSLAKLNELSAVAILRPEKSVKVVEYYFHGNLEFNLGTKIFFYYSSELFAEIRPGFTVKKVFFVE